MAGYPRPVELGELAENAWYGDRGLATETQAAAAFVLANQGVDDAAAAQADIDTHAALTGNPHSLTFANIPGVLDDSQIPAGIARDAEMSAAIQAAVDAVVAAAPGTLDTLDEIAAALGDDPNFATTITTLIGSKVAKSDYDANTILAANLDNTPIALTIAEDRILGRLTGGNIAGLTTAQTKALLAIAIDDVNSLSDSLDSKSNIGHGHAIADVTGLQAALDGKSATGHTHAASDITSGIFAAARLPFTALGVHYPFVRASGSVVTTAINGGGNTNIANAVNRLQAYPFIPMRDCTIDALLAEVSTLHAANFILGIYSDSSGYPDAMLKQTAEISAGSTGLKTGTLVGGGSYTLNAGTVYWLAIHSNTTATFRGIITGAYIFGNSAATLSNGYHTCISTTGTAYSALGLPATFPAAIGPSYATLTTIGLRVA